MIKMDFLHKQPRQYDQRASGHKKPNDEQVQPSPPLEAFCIEVHGRFLLDSLRLNGEPGRARARMICRKASSMTSLRTIAVRPSATFTQSWSCRVITGPVWARTSLSMGDLRLCGGWK